MSRPRVLLADDHTLVAQSLARLLADDFEIVRIVRDGVELVDAAVALRPDLIVSDISMPNLGGLEAMARFRKEGVEAKVIFLTMFGDAALAGEAIRAGAVGYVLKEAAADELFAAIQEAEAGRTYVTPRLAGEMIAQISGVNHARRPITTRQREVLRLIASGLSLKQVAAEMNISTRTVETHKYEMMHALGVDTTAGLIQYAVRSGLAATC